MPQEPHIGPCCFWQGQKVRLRAWASADAESMAAEEQDSEAIRAFEGGIQPTRSVEMLRSRLGADDAPHVLSFAVESLGGELVGTANLRDWQNRAGTFTFAIRIYRAYQRRGYARDAMRILLRYGFYELRCQKANSATIGSNAASIQLHYALGFKDEGRIRRNCYTDGQYDDELLFGLTREEFDALEARTQEDK
jgi:RimJ/RimL family protein N-acetyltransferase